MPEPVSSKFFVGLLNGLLLVSPFWAVVIYAWYVW
jgi:hypothetical protein